MHCSRCVLPVLALYLLLDEISAAVLPNRNRDKRQVSWPGQEHFSRLSEHANFGDLFVGDGAVGQPARSEMPVAPTDHQSVQHQRHRANEKRRKIAPLDSIGSFQMSGSKNRKDLA